MERLRALDCSPPPPPASSTATAEHTGGTDIVNTPHETDLFYSNPEVMTLKLLDEYQEEEHPNSDATRAGYTHIAMFSDMATRLQPLLEKRGFSFSRRDATPANNDSKKAVGGATHFFHAHIIDDDRASSEIVLVTNQASLEKAIRDSNCGKTGTGGS